MRASRGVNAGGGGSGTAMAYFSFFAVRVATLRATRGLAVAEPAAFSAFGAARRAAGFLTAPAVFEAATLATDARNASMAAVVITTARGCSNVQAFRSATGATETPSMLRAALPQHVVVLGG